MTGAQSPLHRSPLPPEGLRQVLAVEQRPRARSPFDVAVRDAIIDPSPSDTGIHWNWLGDAPTAYAAEVPGAMPTFEITAVDAPAATALLQTLRKQHPHALLWTHGTSAQGHTAAVALGLEPARELLLLRRELLVPPPQPPLSGTLAGIQLRTFDETTDPDDWLHLNAAAFRELPDQGGWTRSDLLDHLRAPWFDHEGFIVAVRADGPGGADGMVGFHWTKIDPEFLLLGQRSGEVFVIAVADELRGTGLAESLLTAGLRYLYRAGLRQGHLYVDAANIGAIRLYQAAEFRQCDTDRQYRW